MPQVNRRHSLSKAALETSNAPVFLLDAFSEIFVYYSASCPSDIPFPPPHRTQLWRQIGATRAQRQGSHALSRALPDPVASQQKRSTV